MRSIGVTLLAIAVGLCACNREPHDLRDKVAAVEEGWAHPSGGVRVATARAIFSAYKDQRLGWEAFRSIGLIDAEERQACTWGGVPDGRVDLSCATHDDVSGWMKIQPGNPDQTLVWFDDACLDGVCMTGLLVTEASSPDGEVRVLAASIDMSQDGQVAHLFFGKASSTRDPVGARTVVFDNLDDSYVISEYAGAADDSYEFIGYNGRFRCKPNWGGARGHCTGPSAFDF